MEYIPYTYRVRFKHTGEYYYGVKYANNSKDIANPTTFWKTYFTSSKRVKLLVEKYGKESFDIEIRRTFSTANEAIQWESKVNKYTTKWETYFNDSYLDGRDQSGSNNGNYGNKHNTETINKIVATRRQNNSYFGMSGKTHSKQSKVKMSTFRKGKVSNKSQYKIDYMHLQSEFQEKLSKFSDTKSRNGKIKPAVRHFSEWYANEYTQVTPNAVYKAIKTCIDNGWGYLNEY